MCLALRYSQYSGYHPLSCQSMMPSTSVLVREMMIFVVARSVCVNRIEDVSERMNGRFEEIRGPETWGGVQLAKRARR